MKQLYTILGLVSMSFLLFTSGCKCKVGANEVKQADQINFQLKEDIKKIVDGVHHSLTTKNSDYILEHLSSHLIKERDKADSLLQWQLVDPDGIAQIEDQFYIDNSIPVGERINHVKGQYSGDNYVFFFQPISEETYVVNYKTFAATETGYMLVSLVLGKEEGEWKIQLMQIGNLEFGGKNAMDYIQLAKKYYEEQNIVAAYMASEYAALLARPASNMFQYEAEQDIETGYAKCRKAFEQKYTMPLFVDQLQPQPVISGIQPYIDGRISYPMPQINYTYNEVVSPEEENEKLHAVIKDIFPGISDIADSIAYEVSYKDEQGTPLKKVLVKVLN